MLVTTGSETVQNKKREGSPVELAVEWEDPWTLTLKAQLQDHTVWEDRTPLSPSQSGEAFRRTVVYMGPSLSEQDAHRQRKEA